MNGRHDRKEPQQVPSYRAPPDTPWYHFLHGNVPNHQIDFIYRPEVPQGRLTRQHFSHLARLMSYIEPERRDMPAFAIGNLSRDDTQHEPGHGAVAILFAMRIRGATDHAGRPDPPFSHAIAAVDRELDKDVLFDASLALYEHIRHEPGGQGFYPQYVHAATEHPLDLAAMLGAHVTAFDDLPGPATSTLALRWTSSGASQSRRIVIVRPDDCPFEQIVQCAAHIAAVLYRSDIRWTSITSGRELDIPNGVSIRLVAERDASHVAPDALILPMDQVPAGEDELAFHLFGAKPVQPDYSMPSARAPAEYTIASMPAETSENDVARAERVSPPVMGSAVPTQAAAVHRGSRRWIRVGLGLACILSMAVGAYEWVCPGKSSRDVQTLMSLPRGWQASAATAAAQPQPAPAKNASAWPAPIAPRASTATPAPISAHRTPSPARPAGPRPALERSPHIGATGSGPPVPPAPAPSEHGPEAPPFSTLDNEPVNR